MQFGAIVFDIDNVFFDGTYWHRQLHQMVSRFGEQKQFHAFRNNWRTEYLPRVYSGEFQYWDAIEVLFRSIGLNSCQSRELLASSKTKLKSIQATLRPFNGVPETLALLRGGVRKMGIVSNSVLSSQELQEQLFRIGIRTKFDFCLTSRSAGRVLPDVPALQQVVWEMGIPPSQLGYLTRNVERLQVAAEANLAPIFMSDTPRTLEDCVAGRTGRTIQRFSDLLALCSVTRSAKVAA